MAKVTDDPRKEQLHTLVPVALARQVTRAAKQCEQSRAAWIRVAIMSALAAHKAAKQVSPDLNQEVGRV